MNMQRPTDKELRGMTVNERLLMCGLMHKWDEVVRNRNREEMVAILRTVAMTDEQAGQTADSILKYPQRYGF